jgi:S1-C subfamily serine protease
MTLVDSPPFGMLLLRVAQVVAGSPAGQAGIRVGDLLLSAGYDQVTSAQVLQKLMLADAIGIPVALTVLRGEALVDVIAVPVELSAGD